MIETSTGGFFSNTISGNVTNPAGGQVVVGNNTGLVLSGSTVTNTGSITLASIVEHDRAGVWRNQRNVDGRRLGDVDEHERQSSLWNGHEYAYEPEQHDLRGSGTIKSLGIVNNGTILANTSTPLIILPTTAGINNQGTLSVGSGSLMEIGTSSGGALLNFSEYNLDGRHSTTSAARWKFLEPREQAW